MGIHTRVSWQTEGDVVMHMKRCSSAPCVHVRLHTSKCRHDRYRLSSPVLQQCPRELCHGLRFSCSTGKANIESLMEPLHGVMVKIDGHTQVKATERNYGFVVVRNMWSEICDKWDIESDVRVTPSTHVY